MIGDLEMDEGEQADPEADPPIEERPTLAGYHVELEGSSADKFTVRDHDASIAGTLTAAALGKLDSVGVNTFRIFEVKTNNDEIEIVLEGEFGEGDSVEVNVAGDELVFRRIAAAPETTQAYPEDEVEVVEGEIVE